MGAITHVWAVGERIPIEIPLTDADTGLGIAGQAPQIKLTIQRDSDGLFWTGSAWGASTFLPVTEVDAANQPGRYRYLLPANAGTIPDYYIAHGKIDNTPIAQGEDYEFHVSKGITALRGVQFVPSLPSDPLLCVIYDTLVKGDGSALVGATVSFTLLGAQVAENFPVSTDVLTAVTDETGQFQIELLRGSRWIIDVDELGINDRKRTVPDADSQKFSAWT